jgi:hypothetical protein
MTTKIPTITNNATAEAEAAIPSTISINGVDYDPAQVETDINFAKTTRELETKYNTSFDKVWPEYGKSQETLKQREAELAEAKAQLTAFQTKQTANIETPKDIQEAREAARKLGISLDEDLDKRGYIKKEELPALFQSYQQEQNAVRQVMDTADKLEKEIDGSDGRPAFNKKVVLAYAAGYNIPDLQAAYDDMNKPQLDAWKTAQINDKRNPGLKTLASGGKKEVTNTKVNDSNKGDLLKEALWGNNNE